jgi:hypothetical protein
MEDVAGPAVANPRNVRQLVAQAGGDQQSPSRDPLPAREQHPEPYTAVRREVGDDATDDLAAVARNLTASGGQQLAGLDAIADR